jgi:hypothetical protein
MGVVPLIPSPCGAVLFGCIPKRRLLLITQSLMLIQAIAAGRSTWTGLVQIWHVYVMAFLLGALSG